MRKRLLTVLPVAVLAACNSPSTFPVAVVSDVAFSMTDTTLTFVAADGTTMTLERDETYDYGSFVGALQAGDGEKGMISMYRSQDATASIAVRYLADSLEYTTVYERLVEADRPTTGSATFNGEFISAFVAAADESTDESALPSQVRSDFELVVDFRAQTVEGEITNRTAYLFGLPYVFTLGDGLEQIDLQPTRINGTGNFSGQAVYAGEGALPDVGTYEGMFAGDGGSEVVGAITIGGEAGVFAGVAE